MNARSKDTIIRGRVSGPLRGALRLAVYHSTMKCSSPFIWTVPASGVIVIEPAGACGMSKKGASGSECKYMSSCGVLQREQWLAKSPSAPSESTTRRYAGQRWNCRASPSSIERMSATVPLEWASSLMLTSGIGSRAIWGLC